MTGAELPYGTNHEAAEAGRLAYLRTRRGLPRPAYLTDRGRRVYGPTPPGGSIPSPRTSDLTPDEVDEVLTLIATGRLRRQSVVLPDRLRARSWRSVEEVLLALEDRLGWTGAGWKVGAASLQVRRDENMPSPSPGQLFAHTIFSSPAEVGPEPFVNYRLCECEFAFELGATLPTRTTPYTENDVAAAVAALRPALEVGDSVFEDWYSLSGYFGGMYDNCGGAALVTGRAVQNWRDIDLPRAGIDLYVNDSYIKSGQGVEAMGHPLTSLTWMVNWLRERGRDVVAGDLISTGTCTGHCFVSPGDRVSVDFGELGLVEAAFG